MGKKTSQRSGSRGGKGSNDLFTMLKEDHRTVQGLFKEILKEKERNEEVFEQINMELDIHTSAEEKHFYPKLEENEKTRELTLEAYEEHNVVKELKEKISEGEAADDDERWLAKLKVLSDMVDHHIEEEEKMMFPKAKQVLDKEELDEIAEAIMQEKESGEGAGQEEDKEVEEESESEEEQDDEKESDDEESTTEDSEEGDEEESEEEDDEEESDSDESEDETEER